MKEILEKIIANVLTAIYQPFLLAIALSVLFMFFHLYAIDNGLGGKGYKQAMKSWCLYFKNDKYFRLHFFCTFSIALVLFQTLINRNMWVNPVQSVMEGWWIYKLNPTTGERILTTECIENLILFMPFAWSFTLYSANRHDDHNNRTICANVFYVGKTVFYASLAIEFTQLFLRLGTFQISDLVYNTLGGIIMTVIVNWVRVFQKKNN